MPNWMTPKSRIASTGKTRVNSTIVWPCCRFFRNLFNTGIGSSFGRGTCFLKRCLARRRAGALSPRVPAPRHVLKRLEDVDHRHDVSLDAGGEQEESPDDEDRDDGENHAVLGHRLTLFPPANGGEQLGEVGHFCEVTSLRHTKRQRVLPEEAEVSSS